MSMSRTGASQALPRPCFEDGRARTIASLRERHAAGSLDGIPALWRRWVALGKVSGSIGQLDYAIVFLFADGCDIAGCEVAGFGDLPRECICVEIPPRTYALFSHDGHVATLRHTFDAIMRNWLPERGLQIAGTARAGAYVPGGYGERFDPRTGLGDIQESFPVAEAGS